VCLVGRSSNTEWWLKSCPQAGDKVETGRMVLRVEDHACTINCGAAMRVFRAVLSRAAVEVVHAQVAPAFRRYRDCVLEEVEDDFNASEGYDSASDEGGECETWGPFCEVANGMLYGQFVHGIWCTCSVDVFAGRPRAVARCHAFEAWSAGRSDVLWDELASLTIPMVSK
jgi:hypothetical protein